jgi:hypothetical protein
VTDFGRLLAALASHDVQYIIVGGFAATAHGSAFLTVDLDIVYARSSANIDRLVAALEPLIRLERAAGRPKDLERIAELEALHSEQHRDAV